MNNKKRKDKKGRILKTGESQRKDFVYQYRYIDFHGKRQTVYASTLQELRQKEKEIQKQVDDGLDYEAGQITVIELIEKYISLKQGVRYNTKVGYQFVLNLVKKEEFGYRKISTIKVSDAKQWFMKLQKDGRGYSTITSVRGVIKPAFQMAYDEDAVRKNPFAFKLTDAVVNDSEQRIALTDEQLEIWMDFIKNDNTYCKYYDEFVVLLETGMRVSEFCGLTKKDLDFKNRRIRVDHQLVRERGGKYYVEETKISSGCRFLPMTDSIYQSLKNMLARRPKVKKEVVVDGYTGFIMLDKNGNPKVALHVENEMRWAMKKYKKLHPDRPLPNITPHVLRHTFCTNYANAGMDIKDLQYLMGHSDAGVTLNVYTHANYAHAADQMAKITDFRQKTNLENEKYGMKCDGKK
ncbi:tyrosine-type recombinase/integrase [Bariatricus sp. HCP28S3_C2]|uniref:tyrosine-type recombinase/integrase n=1 Tax=unclassified Bariatricus TaxID=2677046 RepID=UPI003F8CA47D